MARRRISDWLHTWITTLLRASGANVTFTFALAVIPIVGAVGTAVDYSRANAARTAMQNALDAAALTLGKEAPSLNPSVFDQRANDYFNALFKQPDTTNPKVTSKFNANAESLTLHGTGHVKTTFARVLGFKTIKINVDSTVVWGSTKKVEVALVLDNTGSMSSSGKIEALKTAARLFVDAMQKASKKPDDVRIAVVPFDTHVNIGPSYSSASWIDWSLMNGSAAGDNSTWNGTNNYGDADDDTRYDEDRSSEDTWTGCVIDRQQPNDVDDTSPSGNSTTWYPAENCRLAMVQPLTYDFNVVRNTLGTMKADGKTNLTIGLVWGWHALTPNVPLTEGGKPTRDVEKYIVFLTDGMNTQNRTTTKAIDIDARTKLVCNNIKKAGIKIYTIRVMEGNQSLLQGCASNPAMYFNVTAANQMSPVFEEIARSLRQLRISR